MKKLIYSKEDLDLILSLENEEKDKEIERLNNIINELNTAYCKVITKCEEMIDSRFYMNDIAIKKYSDEIKDICKYYVGEAKELKGSGSNE